MLFRTEIKLNPNKEKIAIEDKIFSIGSCFATEMHNIFTIGKIQTLNNPFGTIFHPIAINTVFKKINAGKVYTEEDLIHYEDKFISLDHNTIFDNSKLDKCLKKINSNLESAKNFLSQTKWIIITFGTSWIYEFIENNKIVANCHKIPQKFFKKRLLTFCEIKNAISETLQILKNISPNIQILLSISPVRHLKDGFIENQRSKSLLINAVHDAIEIYDCCHYLPVYEILMDDLRDYRFYKGDLIHPNDQAISYIWEKFSETFLSRDTINFINKNMKLNKYSQHKQIIRD